MSISNHFQKYTKNIALLLLIIVMAISFTQEKAISQDLTKEQQETFMSLIGQVMSPYCPGKLLSDCPSTKASELKGILKEKITQGQTLPQLIEFLENQYGKETIKSQPDSFGFGFLAWITPVLFLLLGGFFYWRWLSRSSLADKMINTIDIPGQPLETDLQEIENRAKKDLS